MFLQIFSSSCSLLGSSSSASLFWLRSNWLGMTCKSAFFEKWICIYSCIHPSLGSLWIDDKEQQKDQKRQPGMMTSWSSSSTPMKGVRNKRAQRKWQNLLQYLFCSSESIYSSDSEQHQSRADHHGDVVSKLNLPFVLWYTSWSQSSSSLLSCLFVSYSGLIMPLWWCYGFSVLFLLGTSAYAVVLVVERSQDMPENPSWIRENEVTLVVAGVGIVYPNIFNLIGMVESYHPGVQLKWQLARILVLNLLNLYTLMFSLFGKVDIMTASLNQMKHNITVDKRLRMTWESEVTVTIFTDPKARVERALEEIEGRFYSMQQSFRKYEEERITSSDSPEMIIPTDQRPLVIKDEWSSSNQNEPDGYSDVIEGRRRLPTGPKYDTPSRSSASSSSHPFIYYTDYLLDLRSPDEKEVQIWWQRQDMKGKKKSSERIKSDVVKKRWSGWRGYW